MSDEWKFVRSDALYPPEPTGDGVARRRMREGLAMSSDEVIAPAACPFDCRGVQWGGPWVLGRGQVVAERLHHPICKFQAAWARSIGVEPVLATPAPTESPPRVPSLVLPSGRAWTLVELQEALDVLIASYLNESGLADKRPGNTTVLELIVWNGERLKKQTGG